MTTTNLAITPYFDDFDPAKDFHQLLFKPGYSVQARELTQIQSIVRDQIAKFGNHVFKHGSVVIPGNTNSDLNICYVKLQTTELSVVNLSGKVLIGDTSGLRGIIRGGIDAIGGDPSTLYVSYYNSGTSGEAVYIPGESLTVENDTSTFIVGVTAPTGGASMAFITKGVFFINGSFVSVAAQSVVIGKYTSLPSCRVLLKITETIIDSNTDASLLDPAQGSYNYAAPGADRLKISLSLTTLLLSDNVTEDYVELMRFNEGVLEEHSRYPKYNELEKSLARRTFEESGDYVVNGLDITVREHLRSGPNNGRYESPTGDASKLIYTVSPGKAYINGFENEIIAPKELVSNKTRGVDHLKTTVANISPSFGQFFYVTNIVNLPNFLQKEQVTLYNASSGGASIGTARVIAIDYLEPNTTDSNAIFKLFVNDVVINGGSNITQVGNITFSGGTFTVLSKLVVITSNTTNFVLDEVVTSGTRLAKAHKFTRSNGELYVYKHSAANDVPVIGDNVTATSTAAGRVNSSELLGKNAVDNLLIKLPKNTTFSVKNASNATDMSYKLYYETTVSITGGTGSFSVTGLTIDPKEQGNFIIASAAGIHPLSTATVAPDGLSVSFAGISPVSTTLKIVCAATKTGSNAAPKTKSLVTSFTQTGVTPASLITLSKADGVRLRSVTSTVDGLITDRYKFDNGQRDYGYLRASISLIGTAPTGTLTIVYDYFNHNAGSGDYFCVNSYESSGLPDFYTTNILKYTSKNSGLTYDLRDALDFRSRIGDDGTYSSGTAMLSRVPQIDSRLSTSVQNYVGRIDAVAYDRSGVIRVINGVPSEYPITPQVSPESIYLCQVVLPPYVYSTDDVIINKQNNKVFTMKDISNLENRLSNLEEYVTLNETENSTIDFDIVDATTGLSRFKSGYLIDSFTNPDTIADVTNPFFKVSYSSENIVPLFEVFEAPLVITANTCQITGDALSLPYTEVIMINQPVSSKITNINPFSVFSWSGTMKITPAYDTWVDIENLSAIVENKIDYVDVTQIVEVTEVINKTEVVERNEFVTVRRPWNWVAPIGAKVQFSPAPVIIPTLPIVPPFIPPNIWTWNGDNTR